MSTKKSVTSTILIILLLLNLSEPVSCIEPVTTIIGGLSAFVISAAVGGYEFLKCRMYECCNRLWINNTVPVLRQNLTDKLFGQHLVIDTVTKHVSAHIRNPNPAKALVLSFHGWTGTGKNYVSKIISENIYAKGMKSSYVHLIPGDREFPHEDMVETYKDRLQGWIEGNITRCPHSVFIIDEIDKVPRKLLDVIKPYIEYYEDISGTIYRHATFIFISNTGGNAINNYVIDHWRLGGTREEIQLKDLETIVTSAAYSAESGLFHSELISKSLVTAFIPFLPLERRHVKQCIMVDLVNKGFLRSYDSRELNSALINAIADQLNYYPAEAKLFSTTGCKRVSEKVDFIMEDI